MFLPTTPQELAKLGWDRPDIILVTGDSYIDSPFIGSALIGKVLSRAGYRVAIIAQPDIHSDTDICRLGEPRLFWGVTAGSVDSMVANYTSLKKKRKSDDYTPGGVNNRRPDQASIVYTNLIKQYFKHTRPIVLGGIEASLRRVAHYDFWTDRIRPSILFDAKADYLLYGMAEKAILELAAALKNGTEVRDIRGLCYIAGAEESAGKRAGYLALPPFEAVEKDANALTDMFHTFYQNNDALSAKGLYQQTGNRYLIQNPPPRPFSQKEMDEIYELDFERAQHPYYQKQGAVKALETIRFSIQSHRGCYGECNFCAIAMHEGRTVQWRSPESILAEARILAGYPDFKGYIQDIGGPTANMYGFECEKKLKEGACADKRCLYPQVCPSLKVNHHKQLEMLKKVRTVTGIKKVFAASGIRYDLLLADRQYGEQYLKELVQHHISGQMKVAPEHTQAEVLNKMGKPGISGLLRFKELFDRMNKKFGKEQFLTYYLIAAHPGCTRNDMQKLRQFTRDNLKMNPEQVQIFLPAPSTYSSLMYCTGLDPFTKKPLFVEKDPKNKEQQKNIAVAKETPNPVPQRRPRPKRKI
ncbi:YgiQ family radical SAM protein [Dehalococcoides mccartyi]|uniref:YgiQ family radical SAM protein n=1 Tax=Dehalococcoides mccartyi TaxID=61435 RepID=UPI00098F66AD|nr:YgiQ family radical SAM protein [Dehalococcoides mccartyi]AQU03690.1 YgiQ family radical SAM protein [Dehalococcoides mccartyi]AQU04990.1 YgiQ family radical SAM protein [Dehalococcoides mccartyi]